MRFEDNIHKGIDRNLYYERAQSFIDSKEVKMSDFEDHYGKEVVAKDRLYVEKMEGKFSNSKNSEQAEANKLATVFEAVFHEGTSTCGWLGENVSTIKTSRYDDIANGIDEIAEIQETPTATSYLGLAIDVTISSEAETKIKDIKQNIEEGKLSKIKYFQSPNRNFKGSIDNVPRVVVGVAGKTVQELSELWLNNDKDSLKKHPVQLQVLRTVLEQLKTFEKYSAHIGEDDLANVYKENRRIISNIYTKKKKDLGGELSDDYDEMYDRIFGELSRISRSSYKKRSPEDRKRFQEQVRKRKET